MKARPLRELLDRKGFEECEPSKATHVELHCPGPFPTRILSLNIWSWNKSVLQPTIKPSIRTDNGEVGGVCHSYVTDGKIKFLADSTHSLKNQTVDLLDVT